MIVKWYLNLLTVMHNDTVSLCGDFNSRHPLMGSEGSTITKNGKVYYEYIQNTSDLHHLLCSLKKTHFLGGKLYSSILSVHIPNHCKCCPVLGDHWAFRITLPFRERSPPHSCFRYCLANKHHDEFINAGIKTLFQLALISLMKLSKVVSLPNSTPRNLSIIGLHSPVANEHST